ncbi:MAG: glycosyltransferase [Proteobacteria bacterium]|nr:glycosyltransferase [Pseudomonadota bacterium]
MVEPFPDLTVCVAGFGPPETTRRFLRTLHDTADHVALEIFLICRGDRRDLSTLQAEFPELTILALHSGSYVNGAVNQAIAASRGRYFSVWDDNTMVAGGCLQGLVDFLDEVPDAGIAGPKMRDEEGEIQPVARRFPSFFSLLAPTGSLPGHPAVGWNEYAGGESDWYAGPGVTISRLLLDDIGKIHPGLMLYWPIDLCLRARRAGWHVHYLRDAQATGSLSAWQQSLTSGRELWWRRLWEACLLKTTWRLR